MLSSVYKAKIYLTNHINLVHSSQSSREQPGSPALGIPSAPAPPSRSIERSSSMLKYRHAFTAQRWWEVSAWMKLRQLRRVLSDTVPSNGRVRHRYHCPTAYANKRVDGDGPRKCAYRACVVASDCGNGAPSGPYRVYLPGGVREHTCTMSVCTVRDQ